MSMTCQDIINASSTDFRSVLSSSSPDSSLFISWVDRIQKDALHTGIYNPLIQAVATVSTVVNTSTYTITTTPNVIRRILMVYDRTFDKVLMPMDSVTYPTKQADATSPVQPLQIPKEMLSATTNLEWPEYYRRIGTSSLYIFPAPQKAALISSLEVHYEFQVADIANTTDTLTLPNDAKDMVVAGVNQYVAQFLHLDQETQFWQQQYQALKNGIAIQ